MDKTILKMLQELRPEFDFENSDDFIVDGYLDSFDITLLTSMLEDEFGIKIDALDIIPENFSGIGSISTLVAKSGGAKE